MIVFVAAAFDGRKARGRVRTPGWRHSASCPLSTPSSVTTGRIFGAGNEHSHSEATRRVGVATFGAVNMLQKLKQKQKKIPSPCRDIPAPLKEYAQKYYSHQKRMPPRLLVLILSLLKEPYHLTPITSCAVHAAATCLYVQP